MVVKPAPGLVLLVCQLLAADFPSPVETNEVGEAEPAVNKGLGLDLGRGPEDTVVYLVTGSAWKAPGNPFDL